MSTLHNGGIFNKLCINQPVTGCRYWDIILNLRVQRHLPVKALTGSTSRDVIVEIDPWT